MSTTTKRSAIKTIQPLAIAVGIACFATSTYAVDWVGAGASIEGDAKIELSRTFGKKAGTFAAVPESVLDNKRSIKGNFVTGSYRYVYNNPEKEGGKLVDETVHTEVLDCKNNYFGALKTTKKYRGTVVHETVTPDKNITMMQTNGPTVSAQLCELHAGTAAGAPGRNGAPNPDYRPGTLSNSQADAIIDKYAPASAKK